MGSEHVDAIHMAAQIGRLDVLSILIALLSLAIAVATILGFWFYGRVVDKRAKIETSSQLPSLVKKYFEENPDILVEALRENKDIIKSLKLNGTNKEEQEGDDIARTIDKGDGNDT
jgi:flagellar basal body-associated protein FliL